MINNTGVGIYPLNIIEWIISIWPPVLSCLLSSIILILVLISSKQKISIVLKKHTIFILPLFSLLAVSLLGLINTSEYDYAILFLWHLLGTLNFIIAIIIHIENNPTSRKTFITAVCLGTLASVFYGIYQVIFGFEETRKIAIQIAQEEGRSLHPDMINRLNQTRTYASFTYPNSYAAHLILTIPILIVWVWKMGKQFHPPRISQIILTGITLAISTYCLITSGSRGAVAAIAISAVLLITLEFKTIINLLKQNKAMLLGSSLFFIFAFAVLSLAVFRNRDWLSVSARLDYYTTAIKMIQQYPILGVGLGEFFPFYLKLKPPGAEETRLAHNLFLHFASQCGFIGGVAAILFLIHPVILWLNVKKGKLLLTNPTIFYAIFLGICAWLFHSLTDFNIQISGTVIIVCLLPILTIKTTDHIKSTSDNKLIIVWVCVLAIIGFSPLSRFFGEEKYQRFYNKQYKSITAQSLVAEVKAVSSTMPFSPYPWDILGKKSLQQSQIDLAIYSFQEANKRTPHRAAYYAFLAQCKLSKRELSEALENINTALIWYPHKPQYLQIKQSIEDRLP